MKLGVLSDIHSAWRPLEVCLKALKARGAEGFLLLGDYISDCPEPEKTMDLLRELMAEYPCFAVKGNREEYVLDWRAGKCPDWFYGSGSGSLLYTAENLSAASYEWFEGLPITRLVELPGCAPLRICHGGPGKTRQLLWADSNEARQVLEGLDTDYLLGGHCHKQVVFRWQGRTLFNPGAVRGFNTAQCGLLTSREGGWDAELLMLSYDAERYADEIAGSEFTKKAPMWAKALEYELRHGVDALEALVVKSWKHIRALDHPNEDEQEQCWRQAAKELGII